MSHDCKLLCGGLEDDAGGMGRTRGGCDFMISLSLLSEGPFLDLRTPDPFTTLIDMVPSSQAMRS